VSGIGSIPFYNGSYLLCAITGRVEIYHQAGLWVSLWSHRLCVLWHGLAGQGSNLQPPDPKSGVLPVELPAKGVITLSWCLGKVIGVASVVSPWFLLVLGVILGGWLYPGGHVKSLLRWLCKLGVTHRRSCNTSHPPVVHLPAEGFFPPIGVLKIRPDSVMHTFIELRPEIG
jgi:hypothetical protein